eukprot:TRINITY_DN3436_c0_g2_i1.p1 TRINITY_DN3436_c0_g2~~TRINITY_DN3436_c0_g2_i1.p1  ORF type:complete len:499 (+),score=181.50 TRINITY_DN3436_c0_g2_i1:100-1596(+)
MDEPIPAARVVDVAHEADYADATGEGLAELLRLIKSAPEAETAAALPRLCVAVVAHGDGPLPAALEAWAAAAGSPRVRTLYPVVLTAAAAVVAGDLMAVLSALRKEDPPPPPPADLWGQAYAAPLQVVASQLLALRQATPAAQAWLEAVAAAGRGAGALMAALWAVGVMALPDRAVVDVVTGMFSEAGGHPLLRARFLAAWCMSTGEGEATAALAAVLQHHQAQYYGAVLQLMLDEVQRAAPGCYWALLRTWVEHGGHGAVVRAVQHPPAAHEDAAAKLILHGRIPQLTKALQTVGGVMVMKAPLLAPPPGAGGARPLLALHGRILWQIMNTGRGQQPPEVLEAALKEAEAGDVAATGVLTLVACALLPGTPAELDRLTNTYLPVLKRAMAGNPVAGLAGVVLSVIAHDRGTRRLTEAGELLLYLSGINRDALDSWVSPDLLFKLGGQTLLAEAIPLTSAVEYLTSINLSGLRLNVAKEEQLLRQAVRTTLDCCQTSL